MCRRSDLWLHRRSRDGLCVPCDNKCREKPRIRWPRARVRHSAPAAVIERPHSKSLVDVASSMRTRRYQWTPSIDHRDAHKARSIRREQQRPSFLRLHGNAIDEKRNRRDGTANLERYRLGLTIRCR
jgi:hypothetical protein